MAGQQGCDGGQDEQHRRNDRRGRDRRADFRQCEEQGNAEKRDCDRGKDQRDDAIDCRHRDPVRPAVDGRAQLLHRADGAQNAERSHRL